MNFKTLAASCLQTYLILVSISPSCSFSYGRVRLAQGHILVKRSHSSHGAGLSRQLSHSREQSPPHTDEPLPNDPATHSRVEVVHRTPLRMEEDTLSKALSERGLTRIIFDEEGIITDDDYYYDDDDIIEEETTFVSSDDSLMKKDIEKMYDEKKKNEHFPKKFEATKKEETDKKGKKHSTGRHMTVIQNENNDLEVVTVNIIPDSEEDKNSPTKPSESSDTHKTHFMTKKDDPLALPVTTEGKTNVKHKTEDPLKVYGFPKELLPIMPGGGSRFEDVEREKLEKKKMSQTKSDDDNSAENGSSHEAEGLYSSASLSSISLCFYWLVLFHPIDRIAFL